MTTRRNLTGQQFGRLRVTGFARDGANYATLWNVECACGRPSAPVISRNLITGNTTQCAACGAEARNAAPRSAKPKPKPFASAHDPQQFVNTRDLIADRVTSGLQCNTLKVREPIGPGRWRVDCVICRAVGEAETAGLLAGAAKCGRCRPMGGAGRIVTGASA